MGEWINGERASFLCPWEMKIVTGDDLDPLGINPYRRFHPIGLGLDELAEIFLRIARLEITGSLTNIDDDIGTYDEIHLNLAGAQTTGSPPAHPALPPTIAIAHGTNYGFSIEAAASGADIPLIFTVTGPVWVYGGEFYPVVVAVIGPGGEQHYSTLHSDDELGDPSGITLNTILGELPMYKDTGTDVAQLTGTVNILPPATAGYYPYRDRDGLNPVWDKDDGSQLIIPSPSL